MKKKKKSQATSLIVAVVVLILLCAVYFMLDWKQKKDEAAAETEESTEETLPVSVTQEEFSKVSIKYEGTTMTFAYQDDTWSYEEDPDFPLKSTLANSKLNNLTNISVSRKLEDPAELSEYGLDDPMMEVTVEKTDDTSFTLYIGDENASTGDYYAMVDDGEEIYTIGSSLVSALSLDIYDLAEAEELPGISSENIQSVTVEKDGETNTFTCDSTGLVWTLTAADGTENAVDSTSLDTLLAEAADLSFDRMVDYKGEDLEQYGLKEPAATVTIVTEETEVVEVEAEDETAEETEADTTEAAETETEEVTEETEPETEIITVEKTLNLYVGDTNEDGNYYVKQEGSSQVHVMAASSLENLMDIQKLNYLDLYVNDVPMTNMASLKVTYQGETKELTRETEIVVVETEAETEDETAEKSTEAETEETEPETETIYHYLVDGVDVDETTYKAFYNSSILLKAQKRMEEADVPELTGEPDLILEYTQLDGTTLTSEFYLGDDGLYTVLCDPGLPAKASKLDVQDVLNYYVELTTVEEETETETETVIETEE